MGSRVSVQDAGVPQHKGRPRSVVLKKPGPRVRKVWGQLGTYFHHQLHAPVACPHVAQQLPTVRETPIRKYGTIPKPKATPEGAGDLHHHGSNLDSTGANGSHSGRTQGTPRTMGLVFWK
ncbi:hypothetical protein LIA77_07229 [Sarocladium implicatum]|nr:hypothetical protein LIA77_07229 [Sarocladium implicatum]